MMANITAKPAAKRLSAARANGGRGGLCDDGPAGETGFDRRPAHTRERPAHNGSKSLRASRTRVLFSSVDLQ
jgi:hypothetical protein